MEAQYSRVLLQARQRRAFQFYSRSAYQYFKFGTNAFTTKKRASLNWSYALRLMLLHTQMKDSTAPAFRTKSWPGWSRQIEDVLICCCQHRHMWRSSCISFQTPVVSHQTSLDGTCNFSGRNNEAAASLQMPAVVYNTHYLIVGKGKPYCSFLVII